MHIVNAWQQNWKIKICLRGNLTGVTILEAIFMNRFKKSTRVYQTSKSKPKIRLCKINWTLSSLNETLLLSREQSQ